MVEEKTLQDLRKKYNLSFNVTFEII